MMIALGMLALKLLLVGLLSYFVWTTVQKFVQHQIKPSKIKVIGLILFVISLILFASWEYSLRPAFQTQPNVLRSNGIRKPSRPIDNTISPSLEEKSKNLLEQAEKDRQEQIRNW